MRGINFTDIGKPGKIFEPEITRSKLLFGKNNLVAMYGRLQSERRKRNKIRVKIIIVPKTLCWSKLGPQVRRRGDSLALPQEKYGWAKKQRQLTILAFASKSPTPLKIL